MTVTQGGRSRRHMHVVFPWTVDKLREKLARLKDWPSEELEDLDKDIVAHGYYTKTLEQHLTEAQEEVGRLRKTIEHLSR